MLRKSYVFAIRIAIYMSTQSLILKIWQVSATLVTNPSKAGVTPRRHNSGF